MIIIYLEKVFLALFFSAQEIVKNCFFKRAGKLDLLLGEGRGAKFS
jgi:hypothetical protein